MGITIRPATPADVPMIVRGWNQALCHDTVDADRFREVMLGDPNHEPEGTLVAVNGKQILGLMDCIVGAPTEGADQPEAAHMRALYAHPESSANSILAPMLEQLEEWVCAQGCRKIEIVRYTGRYIFPGLDLRYSSLLGFLDEHGFERTSIIDDMDFDLSVAFPTEYQQRAIERAKGYGTTVVDYQPHMLDALREFVDGVQIPHWFREGWEEAYQNMVVAFKGDKLVGWASYSPQVEYMSFGPTAVLPEHRGQGIGTWILVETMLRAKQQGHSRIWAHWTNSPFYEPNGWRVCRQYAFLSKDLDSTNADPM